MTQYAQLYLTDEIRFQELPGTHVYSQTKMPCARILGVDDKQYVESYPAVEA